MGDGGIGIALDTESFEAIVKLIIRGDYLVVLRPIDAPDEKLFVVREGVDMKVLRQFHDCLQSLPVPP